jgi:hypothetical protein
LGIAGLFKKRVRDNVVGTRVLVAVLDGRFSDQAFLVMTLNRREPNFKPFLEMLLSKMSAGSTMPVAWVFIAPQNSKHPQQQVLPECIFAAGRGSVVLR